MALSAFPRRRDGWYYAPKDGGLSQERYVSVTTVLGIIAKPQLIHWAARTAAGLVLQDPSEYDTADKAAAGIYTYRDRAGDRGAAVHSLIEAYTRGAAIDPATLPAQHQGYARAFLAFTQSTSPTFLLTEGNVYSERHGYAGTLDTVARIGEAIWLLDWKTTGDIYKEVALQLAAYRRADLLLTKDAPPRLVPLPSVERTGVVLLRDDGTFRFAEIPTGDEVFDAFLAALRLWRWWRG